ncbi:MAG: flagellar hook-basal body complex protein [Paracoccaceae bacterium]|nr:flagellar hook-basal body complex protein [Paracoccaceae bacterium]
MDNSTYTTLTRQSGLMREMEAVAHNIANMSTTGFRREGVIFAEHVKALDGNEPSLSMANASARHIDLSAGALTQTDGTFDFAIQGDGFFLVETPQGERLTRAGSFTPDAAGELVNMDGHRLLDGGGTPIFIPPDAQDIALAADGTLSADGRPLSQIGLWLPEVPTDLIHEQGVLFHAEQGIVPTETATILQGFTEGSNVEPITEIARMIEVQRAYEMGQTFLDREDQRIRSVIQTLGR